MSIMRSLLFSMVDQNHTANFKKYASFLCPEWDKLTVSIISDRPFSIFQLLFHGNETMYLTNRSTCNHPHEMSPFENIKVRNIEYALLILLQKFPRDFIQPHSCHKKQLYCKQVKFSHFLKKIVKRSQKVDRKNSIAS